MGHEMNDESGMSSLLRFDEEVASADVEQLMTVTAEPLLKYFLRRVRVREDAADCVAETLLVVWRRRDDLPSDHASWVPWCFGVARRVLFHHYRSQSRRIALAERLRLTLTEDRSSHAAAYEAIERDDALARALGSLKEVDRELIGLVAWEGLTIADAATVLGLRPDAARARYSRARARLRRRLAESETSAHES